MSGHGFPNVSQIGITETIISRAIFARHGPYGSAKVPDPHALRRDPARAHPLRPSNVTIY